MGCIFDATYTVVDFNNSLIISQCVCFHLDQLSRHKYIFSVVFCLCLATTNKTIISKCTISSKVMLLIHKPMIYPTRVIIVT